MSGPNRLTIHLSDDGTLDRVFACWCKRCGRSWEERFSSEYVTAPSEAGAVRQAREDCEESHAQDSPGCYE